MWLRLPFVVPSVMRSDLAGDLGLAGSPTWCDAGWHILMPPSLFPLTARALVESGSLPHSLQLPKYHLTVFWQRVDQRGRWRNNGLRALYQHPAPPIHPPSCAIAYICYFLTLISCSMKGGFGNFNFGWTTKLFLKILRIKWSLWCSDRQSWEKKLGDSMW